MIYETIFKTTEPVKDDDLLKIMESINTLGYDPADFKAEHKTNVNNVYNTIYETTKPITEDDLTEIEELIVSLGYNLEYIIADDKDEDVIKEMQQKEKELELKVDEKMKKLTYSTNALYGLSNDILDLFNLDLTSLILALPVNNLNLEDQAYLKELRTEYVEDLQKYLKHSEELNEISEELLDIHTELERISILKDTELTEYDKRNMLS